MVTRVTCVRCAANARAVQTPVIPGDVACFRRRDRAARPIRLGGFALLLFACEFDRGLFGELAVGNLLLSLLPAEGWAVGRVALRLLALTGVGGPARSSLVRKEEEADARGARCDRVAENDVAVAELNVGQRAHADNRDRAAEGIRAEADDTTADRTCSLPFLLEYVVESRQSLRDLRMSQHAQEKHDPARVPLGAFIDRDQRQELAEIAQARRPLGVFDRAPGALRLAGARARGGGFLMPTATKTFTAELDGDLIEIRAGLDYVADGHELLRRFPDCFLPDRGPPGGAVSDQPASLFASRRVQPRCWTLTSERLRVPGLTAGRRCGKVRRESPLRWGRRRDARSRRFLSTTRAAGVESGGWLYAPASRSWDNEIEIRLASTPGKGARWHTGVRTSLRPNTTRRRNSSPTSAATMSEWATGTATPVGTPGRAMETSTPG